jgi:RNA polymerase sigma-70 factor (ECF subfamily)
MSEVDDDAGLIERARRGDEEAFSRLFARYQRVIYRYAAYMCGPAAGDDIVQETFLAVLRQTGRHDALRGTVVGYLFGIARHVVMKRLTLRHDDSLVEPVDDIGSEDVAADQATALDDLTRAETIDVVRAAVHSLPPAYREVVVLCEFQELDYAAAAGVIDCPVGTVRSRLHRARTLLTTKLAAIQPVSRKSRG